MRAVCVCLVFTLGVDAVRAQPACEQAEVLEAGVVAPCSGILWPEAASRAALACKQVELPTCEVRAREAVGLCETARADVFEKLEGQTMRVLELEEKVVEQAAEVVTARSAWSWETFGWGLAGGLAVGLLVQQRW